MVLFLSFPTPVIWSALDRRRKNYNLLHAWLRMRSIPLLDSTGAPIRFILKLDTAKRTLSLENPTDPAWKFESKSNRAGPDRMTIDRQWNGRSLHLILRKEKRSFFLSTRGFHWINETSLNR